MNAASTVTLVAALALAGAQAQAKPQASPPSSPNPTTQAHPSTRPAVHHHAHTATAASRARAAAAARAAEAGPPLPPGVPPAPGKLETAFALRYIDVKPGDGPVVEPGQVISVHYTGWLASDGTKFDSSYDHPGGAPFQFVQGMHRVIPGWDQGFGGMHVGGKRRLFIPYQLAYGDAGRPPVIPPKSDLIFDIELVGACDAGPGEHTCPVAAAPPTPPPPTPQK